MEENNMVNPFYLPAGFRFHPTDEELIVHYLKKKVTPSSSNPTPSIIADINLYNFNPWELPDKAWFGENEWFFYTPRDRKYPNGARPNRATTCGYWKATGCDKPILSSKGSQCIGVKKALVFYRGRPPTGTKTSWIMYEYRLPCHGINIAPRLRGSMRLDDWVLCRIREKSSMTKYHKRNMMNSPSSSTDHDMETFEAADHVVISSQEHDDQVIDEFGQLTLQQHTNNISDGSIIHDNEIGLTAGTSVTETLSTIRRILSLANLDEQMQFLPDDESMFMTDQSGDHHA